MDRMIRSIGLGALLAVSVTTSCDDGADAPPDTAAAASQDLLTRYIEAVNAGDLDAAAALADPAFAQHVPAGLLNFGPPEVGPQLLRRDLERQRAAFPDLRIALDHAVVDGERVIAYLTLSGTHAGVFLGLPPTGRAVTAPLVESFRLADGKLAERWSHLDRLQIAQFLGIPVPDGGALNPAPAQERAVLDPDSFPESLAVDSAGTIYVTQPNPQGGRLGRLAPGGTVETFTDLPLGTIAVDAQDNLYGTVGYGAPDLTGIWRVTPAGETARIAPLPPGSQLNGITVDTDGEVFVADSSLARIWRWRPGDAELAPWIDHPLLGTRPLLGALPGANGIKFFGAALFAANSDSGEIVRIPVAAGGAAGTPSVYARELPTDDFAFDVDGNLYASTHPNNSVIRLHPDGTRETLATAAQAVVGPTAVAFDRLPDRRTRLLVVSDGGWFARLIDYETAGQSGRPNLVELEVGIAGAPVPSP